MTDGTNGAQRTLIAGGPKVGKTTRGQEIATRLGVTLLSTDAVMHLGWSEASEYVAREWLTQPGPWVCEGVAVVRALRKYLAAHDDKPCDELLLGEIPYVDLTPGQRSMAKGVATVWAEISGEVLARGVRVIRIGADQ